MNKNIFENPEEFRVLTEEELIETNGGWSKQQEQNDGGIMIKDAPTKRGNSGDQLISAC
jgi:hypothetical protein